MRRSAYDSAAGATRLSGAPPVRRRAFTLLEVILALALAAVLMTTVFVFYHQVISARQKVMDQVEAVSSTRLVMDRVTGELRGAMAYEFLNIGLEGDSAQMSFFAASLPGVSVWAVVDPAQVALPPQQDIRWVTYRLRTVENDSGETVIEGLERVSRTYVPLTGSEEDEGATITLLARHIQFMALRYWSGDVWLESWTGGDLPTAVEVTLGVLPLPEGAEPIEYPYETFGRVIYLPGSVGAGAGPTVRGLEGGGP